MNWGRIILGGDVDLGNLSLSFTQVTINEDTGQISYPEASLRSKVEV